MSRHSRKGWWNRQIDKMLGDDETKADNRAYRESLRRYHKSPEYQESLIGFKDLMKLVTGVFKHGRRKH